MLLVTITNTNFTFCGLFSTDDKHAAVEAALERLIKKHKFYDDTIHRIPDHWDMALDNCYAVLGTEDDDVDQLIADGENYLVVVQPYVMGEMVNSVQERV